MAKKKGKKSKNSEEIFRKIGRIRRDTPAIREMLKHFQGLHPEVEVTKEKLHLKKNGKSDSEVRHSVTLFDNGERVIKASFRQENPEEDDVITVMVSCADKTHWAEIGPDDDPVETLGHILVDAMEELRGFAEMYQEGSSGLLRFAQALTIEDLDEPDERDDEDLNEEIISVDLEKEDHWVFSDQGIFVVFSNLKTSWEVSVPAEDIGLMSYAKTNSGNHALRVDIKNSTTLNYVDVTLPKDEYSEIQARMVLCEFAEEIRKAASQIVILDSVD